MRRQLEWQINLPGPDDPTFAFDVQVGRRALIFAHTESAHSSRCRLTGGTRSTVHC